MQTAPVIKAAILTVWIAVAAALAPPVAKAVETFTVDPAHTYITFKVKHLGIGHSYGHFNDLTGSFTFDESASVPVAIDMQVQASNIDTGMEKRDVHLRSPDFFNVDRYPTISFKSRSVEKTAEDTYMITGDLTILDQTLPIRTQARQIGAGKDPWGKYRRGLEASFTIRRSEFGMNFMLDAVSDEVDLTISIQGIRN